MPPLPDWQIRSEHGCVFVDDRDVGRVVLQHNVHPGTRPYIHPLRIGQGSACLSEDSPWHHPWQHGVQTCFVGVNGCDFWTYPGTKPGQALGTVETDASRIIADDPHRWGVDSRWRHADGGVVFFDHQEWTLRPGADAGCADGPEQMLLDLQWTMQALTEVEIAQHAYGGLFIRMPYRAATGAAVLSSEGRRDDDTEQQRASWVAVSMPVDVATGGTLGGTRGGAGGEAVRAGIVVLDHPSNRGHPSHWRVDKQRGGNPSPCIAAPVQLAAGEAMSLRYRMLLHFGEVGVGGLDPDRVQQLWQSFASEEG